MLSSLARRGSPSPFFRLFSFLAGAVVSSAPAFGCGDDGPSPSGGGGGGAGGEGVGGAGGTGGGEPPPVITEIFPEQPPLPGETECKVTITENASFEGAKHQTICTEIAYANNPPSSGDHWPVWGQFKSYVEPLPRQMYVHNLEHGGIVMAHACNQGDCAEVIAAFEAARDGFGVDPVCTASSSPVTARFVITPDPLLDEPIGVVGWRASYVATCIDPPSLAAFIEEHYAKGPENVCADGKDPNDPTIPNCTE